MIRTILDWATLAFVGGLAFNQYRLWRRKPAQQPTADLLLVCPACSGKWGKWEAAHTEKTKEYNPYGPDRLVSTTYQRHSCEECGYIEQRTVGTLKQSI